jgi:glutaredoxin
MAEPSPRLPVARACHAAIAAMGGIALIVLAAAVAALATVYPGGMGGLRGLLDEEATPAQTAALAAQAGPGDVTLYTAEGCLYCDLARDWLGQHSFAYTECNISVSPACARAFNAYGARGTPFLVVRGEQMREGFQPGVFLKILRQRPT